MDQVFALRDVLDDSGPVIPSSHYESGFCKTRKMQFNRHKSGANVN